MALVVKDRVKETTTSTGTGTINLAGAVTGFQGFVAGIGDGNTTFYAIEDANGTAWEVGIGTVTDASPDTLARTTILDNSNGDTDPITLSTGTHTVFGTYAAGKAVYLDASGGLSYTVDLTADATGTLPVGNGGTGLTSIATLLNSNVTPTTLSLVIGTNVQAYNADLAAIAGLTSAADKGIQFTGSGTAATYDLTAAGKALLDDADAAAQRTTLGVDAAGTDNSTAVTLVTSSHDYLSISTQAITLGIIDISDDTNLVAGTNISLSGDTLNVDDAFLKNDDDDTTTGTITAGGFTTAGTLTVDSVGISTIQSSGESFADNDTSLMTSAAIDDRINSAVANEDTLAELNDTNISSAAAGHLIIYDNTASVWDNAALTAGSNISITNGDGAITIASTDTNTTYTGGTNLTLDGTTFNVDDAFLINSGDDTTTGVITAGGFTTTGTWTFDEFTSGTVGITTVQDSGTTFDDNDTSLMTAAAIADKIEAYSYSTTTGTVTSVAISGTDGIDVDSGSPITGAGTITLGLSGIANDKLANSSVSFGGVSVALGSSDATPAFDLSDATNYPTSSLSGTITNTQLAGSIANAKLANDSVSFGGITVALGASDATPAFDLADATNYPTSSLSGTITNAQLAGSIANAKLANDSVSFGGITVALGASDATPAFDLSDATSYPTSSLSGTITNAQLAGSIANAKLANSSITVSDGSSSTAVALGGTMTFSGTSNEIEVSESSGAVTIGLPDDVTIAGDLTVNGDTVTVNTATLSVEDPLIILASGNNAADSVDIGFYGLYDTSGSQDLYAGLFRDANDSGKFKLFKDLQAAPTTTVDVSGTGYAVATLVANIEGNVTGNAGTVTTNANLTGHVTSTGNAAVLGSFTVAQLSTALSDASISGSNSGDVTLTGTPDYITISGQEITRNAIDLANDVTGTLPVGSVSTITLGTNTAGNYVATIADSGGGTITVANSGSETAAVTLDIADDSINSEHYVDGSIDTAHIDDLQVTTAKIAADAITGAKIADDAVDSEHYVDGSIDTAHIDDLQVTTAKIADDAVTYAKMQHTTTANRVLGAAGAGAISEVQVSNDMLAGSIANAKLANSTVSYGGIELALGESDATPAFALADATGLPIVDGTTGTLTVARGGTGVTSLSNGQLLIGGSSGISASTLSAGSNVTITNGDGSISIAAAGPLTTEQVQDIVGAMVGGNTESGITVAYDDSDGTLDFTVTLDFDDLSDMASGAPADKDVLVYSSSEWKHVAFTGTASGDVNFSWSEIGTDGVVNITNTEYSSIVPVAKGGTGQTSLENVRAWLFGADQLPAELGGTGGTSFPGNNAVTLGTHTVGDYVATIVPGTGISSSGSSSGEGTAHEIAIDTNWAGQTNLTTLGTITTGTWEGTTIAINQGGTGATSLDDITSANNLLTVGGGAATIIGGDATLTVNEGNFDLDNIGGSLGLTDQVTGTLPIANGGTGATSLNDITSGNSLLTVGGGAGRVIGGDVTLTVNVADIDHDALTNFVANEHIDWTSASAGTIHSSNYTDTNTTYTKASFDLDHLFTLVGASADTDEHLSTFTGSTISDNQTIKQALQALETAVETKGTGTVDVSGTPTAGHVAVWTDADTLQMDENQLFWDTSSNELGIGTATPGSTLHVSGSVQFKTYTVGDTGDADWSSDIHELHDAAKGANHYILCDTGNTNRTVELPDASSALAGRTYVIKKIDAGTGTVTIQPDDNDGTDGYLDRDNATVDDGTNILWAQFDTISCTCGEGYTDGQYEWHIVHEKVAPHTAKITMEGDSGNIANNTTTQVSFDNLDYAVGCGTTITGSDRKVTINRNGKYSVKCQIRMNDTFDDGDRMGIYLYKNGALIHVGSTFVHSKNNKYVYGWLDSSFSLEVDDYLQIKIHHWNGENAQIYNKFQDSGDLTTNDPFLIVEEIK